MTCASLPAFQFYSVPFARRTHDACFHCTVLWAHLHLSPSASRPSSCSTRNEKHQSALRRMRGSLRCLRPLSSCRFSWCSTCRFGLNYTTPPPETNEERRQGTGTRTGTRTGTEICSGRSLRCRSAFRPSIGHDNRNETDKHNHTQRPPSSPHCVKSYSTSVFVVLAVPLSCSTNRHRLSICVKQWQRRCRRRSRKAIVDSECVTRHGRYHNNAQQTVWTKCHSISIGSFRCSHTRYFPCRYYCSTSSAFSNMSCNRIIKPRQYVY